MKFEWDENKNRTNKAKHGIAFETARKVWDDPHCWTYLDQIIDGERRWHTVGIIGTQTFLAVVHTYRDESGEDTVRIIGARRATSHEKNAYARY